MPHPLHDLPRDPETVAAVRELADGQELFRRCRKAACRRAGRCRAAWRPDPFCAAIVLPPCLVDAYGRRVDALCVAEEAVETFEEAVATAGGSPGPPDGGAG